DSFGPEIHRGLQRLFHGAAERYTAFQLQSDIFGDQLRIEFGRLDLENIDVDFFAGQLAQFFLELVDFSPFATNDNTWTGGQNGDTATGRGAFDQDARDRCGFKFFLENVSNLVVLGQQF